MRGTILGLHVLVNAHFFLDPANPIIHLQYIFVVAFSHIQRLSSFFFVMWISLCSTATYLNLRIAAMRDKYKGDDEDGYGWLQVEWLFVAVLLNALLWTYQSYRDELRKKVEWVAALRSGKELQKLKSIVNILVPPLVRQRVQDGKKVADSEADVTLAFIDIVDFDAVAQSYSGRELLDVLDKVFSGFD